MFYSAHLYIYDCYYDYIYLLFYLIILFNCYILLIMIIYCNYQDLIYDLHFWKKMKHFRMGKSLKVSKRRRRSVEVAPSNGSLVDYDYDADENAADIDLSKFDFSEFDFELGERERHLMDMLSLPDTCLFRNILHVWNNDIERIRALDQEQIIVDVNSAINEGSVFLFLFLFHYSHPSTRIS